MISVLKLKGEVFSITEFDGGLILTIERDGGLRNNESQHILSTAKVQYVQVYSLQNTTLNLLKSERIGKFPDLPFEAIGPLPPSSGCFILR